MSSVDPARHLTSLTDKAPTVRTSAEVEAWSVAVSSEIERLQAKGIRLRDAAVRWPTDRRIAKANSFRAAVEPALNRATIAIRKVNAMFFAEPPSIAAH
jgi:hypothetical protein